MQALHRSTNVRLDRYGDVFGWSSVEIDRDNDTHAVVTLPTGHRVEQSDFGLIECHVASIGSQSDPTESGQQDPQHGQHDGDAGEGVAGSSPKGTLASHAAKSSNQSAPTPLLQQDDQDHQRAVDRQCPSQPGTGASYQPPDQEAQCGQNQEEQIDLPVVLQMFNQVLHQVVSVANNTRLGRVDWVERGRV